MTEATSNNGMFTNIRSLGSEDIEAGSSNGHSDDIERKTSQIEGLLEKMEDRGNHDGHVDDIDKWSSSLERILEDVPQYMCSPGHPGRISRIPENLREVDVKAYEPCFLSIGPYHHDKPMVQQMEKRKWFILKCFLEQKPELTLKDYFKEIKSVEPEARSFYLDVEMESETFVRMLLLDSLIILALFCGMPGYQEGRKQRNKDMDDSVSQINECVGTGHDNDNTSQMVARADEFYDESRSGENYMDPPGWFWTFFAHDLFLLENQLPLFILQKIHDLVYGGSQTQLIDIMKGKVGMFLSDYTKLDLEKVITQNMEVHHLLHLCHLFFRPALQQESAAWQLLESSQMFRLGNAGNSMRQESILRQDAVQPSTVC